ncbi:MAG: sulfatase-like hydrolase/transferase [Chloroflexota bacterium]
MEHTNLLVISSDEHNKRFLGCYGSEVISTPNLDKLAAMGTCFTNAYTPSPICMPARAALATGRYLYEIENWDNGTPYRGTEADSWGHRLSAQGHDAPTFGKLHFHPDSDSGFDEHLALHAKSAEQGYIGAIGSWLNKDQPPTRGLANEIRRAEIGEFGYTRYDRATAAAASDWITNRQPSDKPWCAFVSFTYPHYPFCAPAEFVNLYNPADLPLPVGWQEADWDMHPAIQVKREKMGLDGGFTEDEIRWVTAVYFGMISFMDAQVGKVLSALEASPYAENTRIVYTTDHGDMIGEHGMWFKGTMHEGSAGIPMIMTGPGVPQGHVCKTPVNLIDVYPTAIESVGAEYAAADSTVPGKNLVTIANAPDQDRTTYSEYHALGKTASTFMMRTAQYKLIEHIGYVPQLFDIVADPDEMNDLALDPAYADILDKLQTEMREQFDPEAVWEKVSAYQQENIKRLGGVENTLDILRNSPMKRPYTPAPPEFR